LLTEYLITYFRLSVSKIVITAWSLLSAKYVLMTALWNRMQCTRIREVRNVLVDYGALALISMVNSLCHTTTREREREREKGEGEGKGGWWTC
jgi:hypothetical protein